MKILLIVSSSQIGGAEKQLVILAEKLSLKHHVYICILDASGPFLSNYYLPKTTLYTLPKNTFLATFNLYRIINKIKPDTVINWLYKADIIGSFTAYLNRVPSIINSARNTMWPSFSKYKILLVAFVGKKYATNIVANSKFALEWHIKHGLPSSKMILIPNFLDTSLSVRPKKNNTLFTIGIASRAVNGKGHLELIAAIKKDAQIANSVKLSFIGPEITRWRVLKQKLVNSNLHFELLEYASDLSDWYGNLNLYAGLSTAWESDSNSILEAIYSLTPVICSPLQNSDGLDPLPAIVNPDDSNGILKTISGYLNISNNVLEEEVLARKLSLIAQRNPEYLLLKWEELLGN